MPRETRLERPLVESLERQVAAERVLAPPVGNLIGDGTGFQAPVEPAEPVRDQLLTAHLDLTEPGRDRELLKVGRHEGVDIDLPFKLVIGGRGCVTVLDGSRRLEP